MHTSSHNLDLQTLPVTAPASLQTAKRRAMAVTGIFGIGTLICFLVDTRQAMYAYLVGYMLFIGFTLGAMGWVMLWHLTSGRWGLSMRRIWEAGTRNIVWAAVGFIPILISYKLLFPWVGPEAALNEHLHSTLKHYLNLPSFIVRAVIYFAIWFLLIGLLNRWSDIQDRPYSGWLGRKFNVVSSVGLVLYFWTMTFATIDWVMSLRPGWPSTIFPLIVIVGQGIITMSLAIIMGRTLVRHEPMSELMDDVVFHDNGKLLFAFIMLWAYLSFSQWLIIWSGNLPEEIGFYLDRLRGGWQGISLFLALFHFAVPFAILLSSGIKKDPRKLAVIAAWMILMRAVDLFWMVEPSLHPGKLAPGIWMYLVIPVAMVGLWVALFLNNYLKRPVVPLFDPRLRDIYGEAHE